MTNKEKLHNTEWLVVVDKEWRFTNDEGQFSYWRPGFVDSTGRDIHDLLRELLGDERIFHINIVPMSEYREEKEKGHYNWFVEEPRAITTKFGEV